MSQDDVNHCHQVGIVRYNMYIHDERSSTFRNIETFGMAISSHLLSRSQRFESCAKKHEYIPLSPTKNYSTTFFGLYTRYTYP